MTQRFLHGLLSLTVACFCVTSVAVSQSKEDRATVEKARLAYLNHPVPSSIACGVELDWDRFFKEMKIEVTDESKGRLEKLKATKISVASTGPAQTEVKIDASDESKSLADGLRQQLDGFFQMYWPESYGRMLAVKPDETFELTKTPDGYKVKSSTGGTNVEIYMDKAYVITSEVVQSPQMNATLKPAFKPGDDKLLRLRGLEETVELGTTKMVIDVDIDYQKVGEFEVPQHVRMALPGSFSFNYTFVGCVVKGTDAAAPAGKN